VFPTQIIDLETLESANEASPCDFLVKQKNPNDSNLMVDINYDFESPKKCEYLAQERRLYAIRDLKVINP